VVGIVLGQAKPLDAFLAIWLAGFVLSVAEGWTFVGSQTPLSSAYCRIRECCLQ